MTRTMMLFDMRAPDFGASATELYAAAIEMARFADEAGIDRISLPEHHGSEDGYLPAPFVFGAALAAATKRIKILLGAILVPLHDPAELAEQIAVFDLVSQGRLEVIFGAGYVPREFARFGVPLNQRGRLLDDGIAVILRALTGERFDHNGREVFVRPLSHQRPHPAFYVGGGVEAAARRAARYNLGFSPMHDGLWDRYAAECAARGQPERAKIGWGGPISVFVTKDPEQAWARLLPHVLHAANSYVRWAAEARDPYSNYHVLLDEESLRKAGRHRVLTPDECVALARELAPTPSSIVLQPLIGGLDPAIGWESLKLFVDSVLPHIRDGRYDQ